MRFTVKVDGRVIVHDMPLSAAAKVDSAPDEAEVIVTDADGSYVGSMSRSFFITWSGS